MLKCSGGFAVGYREALTKDLERHVLAVTDTVCIEKLWNHFLELLNQDFHILRFSGETGDVVARRDPNPDLVVPIGIDDKAV